MTLYNLFSTKNVVYAAGDYKIDVSYFDCPLPCSPFLVKVWDITKVRVSEIRASHVGVQSSFNSEYAKDGQVTCMSLVLLLLIHEMTSQLCGRNAISILWGQHVVLYVVKWQQWWVWM